MLDQAHDLRQLATHCGSPDSPDAGARPALLAVTGGKGGVGTTTVALRLAEALTHAGKRALLVDADPRGGNAALLSGIEERHSLADVLAGRLNWAEAIEMGQGGIRLIAGARWSEASDHGSPAATQRLIELLGDNSSQADVAVIDVGNNPGRAAQSICRMADAIVLVTTTDPAAVAGAFAAIRAIAQATRNHHGIDAPSPDLTCFVLVNMATTDRAARMVETRLVRACRRLLGMEIVAGDWTNLLHLAVVQANGRKC